MDYLSQYDQESYIFDKVSRRFVDQGYLNAYDFFCIIIWKANRAKSKIAKRLLNDSQYSNLEEAVKVLTTGISNAPELKGKLCLLISGWGFHLPMATAILTILYPNDFTIYDVRVCEQLNEFHNLNHMVNFESIWAGYQAYKQKVELIGPADLSLRDKDRYIWGKSFSLQLENDIKQGFMKNPK